MRLALLKKRVARKLFNFLSWHVQDTSGGVGVKGKQDFGPGARLFNRIPVYPHDGNKASD